MHFLYISFKIHQRGLTLRLWLFLNCVELYVLGARRTDGYRSRLKLMRQSGGSNMETFSATVLNGGVTPIKPSVVLASPSCVYKRTHCGHFTSIVKMLKANALSVVKQSVTRCRDTRSRHSEVQATAFCMTCDCEKGQNRTSFVSLTLSPPQRSCRRSRLHYTYISEIFLKKRERENH